jgi:hypothetical protein
MDNSVQPVFFTDKQLRERWQCSHMRLWRLRQRGQLKKPTKLGGVGPNLTPADEVYRVEGGANERAA